MKNNLPIKIELPEHFLEEEVRCGWTISQKMKKVWAVQIDLLFEFKRICDKYKISWFATAGTMLGAVRHGGYIPWDDDIDVSMLRKDYDIFCKVAHEEIRSPYFFTDGTLNKEFFRTHSQLYNTHTTFIQSNNVGRSRTICQGIFIDIFPVDNIPDAIEEREKFTTSLLTKFHLCQWVYSHTGLYIPKKGQGFLRRWIHLTSTIAAYVIRPFVYRKWPKELFDMMRTYNSLNTTYVSDLSMLPFSERRNWLSIWFASFIEVPFEWFKVFVPCGFEYWLDKHYGVWKEYQVGTSLHEAGVVDPEKPYTEYIDQYLKFRK